MRSVNILLCTCFWSKVVGACKSFPAENDGMLLSGGDAADDFCASVFFGDSASSWRGMVVPPSNELTPTNVTSVLAVDRTTGEIKYLVDANGDGPATNVHKVASAAGLNHGIALDPSNEFVYASSDTTVWRFKFDAQNPVKDQTSTREVVIHSMNADGRGGAPRGHWTRTLIFDKEGRLYISIGSFANVDPNSYRSRIRRFELPETIPAGGIDFATGYVFADGLRNEVGLAFDKLGILWGVENGADNLVRTDLGGDIHNDNPAEELNKFAEPGKFYGYPYCWTEYSIPRTNGGKGRGTLWAWPSFMGDGTHTDAWCRANTVPPAFSMQAHSAPLGMTFYDFAKVKESVAAGIDCVGAFPEKYDGDLFVGFHGSWNRNIPTGYKVVRIPMTASGVVDLSPSQNPDNFLWHHGDAAKWPSGLRPVDVKFDNCGRLLVSSDGTRNQGSYRGTGIVVLTYNVSLKSSENEKLNLNPVPPQKSTAYPETMNWMQTALIHFLSVCMLIVCYDS